ncbi:SURF1 family protein [Aureimonas sp. AU40]|uniref:SURF1 family protein n=1 Tax=Aureimonas sp. AU40 TaxID=1637747 RepID=UPI0007817A8E|nr:SURF1 family protein [Aureimonas sp. AU40]
MPRRSRIVLLALSLPLIVGLLGLGIWQVERRAWKLDLIEHVDQRVHAPAVPAPGPSEWSLLDPTDDEYRHVRLTGTFLHDRETLVQALTTLGGGFWVLTPLQAPDGSVTLVNRGFVPTERRDPASRPDGQVQGTQTIEGLLRLSEPGGRVLRANEPEADRWFSRDIGAIAARRGLERVAPFFVDADAASNPGGAPVGGLTVVQFNNNHLVYALTWFALALMLTAAVVYAWRHDRKPA